MAMSVVNQMLRELDRRRASAAERADLPGMVRALPPPRPSFVRPALAGIALAAACGVATAAWLTLGRDAPLGAKDATPAPAATVEALPRETATQAEPPLKWSMLLETVPAGDPTPAGPRAASPDSSPSRQGAQGEAHENLPPAALAGSARARPGGAQPRAEPAPPSPISELPAASAEAPWSNAPKNSSASAEPPPRAGEGQGRRHAASASEPAVELGEVVIDKRPAESAQPGARDAAAALRDARALAQRGEAGAAAELLRRHGASAAGNAEYRGLHAAVLQRLTLHAEAVVEYRAALRLAPDAAVWWLGLGISLESLGRAGEAREAFEHARAGKLSAELAAYADQRLSALR
jgi:MSHA biogenesis protein MshN